MNQLSPTYFALTALATSLVLIGCGSNSKTTKDTTAPTLQITSNASMDLPSKKFMVTGKASDDIQVAMVSVSVNNGKSDNLTVDAQGNFSGEVTLNEGDNEVVVIAADAAGNTTKEMFAVSVDATKPELTLSSDIVDEVSQSSIIPIKGLASDNKAIENLTIRINEQEAQSVAINADGSFDTTLNLTSGLNQIVFTATDGAGNQSTQSGDIYYGSTLAGGNSHTMAIVDKKVYGWGRNNYGQVGLGKVTSLGDDADHPKVPTIITNLPDNVTSIEINQNHSAALTQDGQVYTWGDDSDGQLGRGEQGRQDCGTRGKENCRLEIGKASLPDINALSSGYSHVLALAKDGSVWAFGENGSGQIGASADVESSSSPIKVNFTDTSVGKIVQVEASSASSYAVDNKGQLWAWGRNKYGNLGQGTVCNKREGCEDFNPTPIKVNFPEGIEISEVATGRDHVLALTTDGKVYGWGLNATSQVGYMGDGYKGEAQAWEKYISSPSLLPWFTDEKVAKHVYANGNTSYVMLTDEKVYPWGMFGETGADGRTKYLNLNEPTDKLPSLTQVVDMGVGALHQVAKRQDGGLYSWGWSFEGSLGAKDITNIWMYNTPVVVSLPK